MEHKVRYPSRFATTTALSQLPPQRWFKELTERRLRRGVFTSVPQLVDAIELWTEHWNDDPKPFIWHKPAKEIITKIRRERAALTRVKSATDH